MRWVVIAAAVLVLSGCSAAIQPLPTEGKVDYQLGGASDPRDGVTVVARDRTEQPAPGVYSICYVNGFQTQPGDLGDWPDDLVLHVDGEPLIDPGWPDEAILDTSTSASRERIAQIVGGWIAACADDGFDAVEFDNLDTYSRSTGLLTEKDNLALATALVERAHREGLAAGQKNSLELDTRGRDEAGFDFAVVEECHEFDECAAFADIWGEQWLDVEYEAADDLCDDPSLPTLTVVRDRDLTPGGPTEDCSSL